MSIFSLVFPIFLIITGIVYFIFPRSYRWIILLISSYVFYCYGGGYRTIVFMLLSTVITFLGGITLENFQKKYDLAKESIPKDEAKVYKQRHVRSKKLILAGFLIANFSMLLVIKYGAFIANSVIAIVGGAGTLSDFILPLGISFYTFQTSGYLIDVFRGRISADRSLPKFALFVSYFPQIIQGPISRYDELAQELYTPHDFDYDRMIRGAQRILWGYIKKLVIADRVAVIVATIFDGFATESYVGFTLFFGAFMYGIQIYADFSGGIDIIIGISEILGIKVTENFRQPYMARSVSEFWQRWHITLGAWMRNYVFYPLSLSKPFSKLGKKARNALGNEIGKMVPPCIASFIVFVLVGVWHGAAWKFVFYGLFQAIFVSSSTLLESVYDAIKTKLHVKEDSFSWRFFQMVRTTVLLTFARYFARGSSFRTAMAMWKATFSRFNPWVFVNDSFLEMGLTPKNYYFMWIMIVVMLVVDIIHEKGYSIRDELSKQDIVLRWTLYLGGLFLLIIFGIYGPGYNEKVFIYQGF